MKNYRVWKWVLAAGSVALAGLLWFSLYNWAWINNDMVRVDILSGSIDIIPRFHPVPEPYVWSETDARMGSISHPWPQDARFIPRRVGLNTGNTRTEIPITVLLALALGATGWLFWADARAKSPDESAKPVRRRSARAKRSPSLRQRTD